MNLNYWKNYFNADIITRSEALRQELRIPSTGVNIHMDVNEQPNPAAPVLIVNHGGGGYSRIFTEPLLAMYERGYTIIAPNQFGQGYSEGDRGDFTVGQFVQNIVDVTHWARARYSSQLPAGVTAPRPTLRSVARAMCYPRSLPRYRHTPPPGCYLLLPPSRATAGSLVLCSDTLPSSDSGVLPLACASWQVHLPPSVHIPLSSA